MKRKSTNHRTSNKAGAILAEYSICEKVLLKGELINHSTGLHQGNSIISSIHTLSVLCMGPWVHTQMAIWHLQAHAEYKCSHGLHSEGDLSYFAEVCHRPILAQLLDWGKTVGALRCTQSYLTIPVSFLIALLMVIHLKAVSVAVPLQMFVCP